MFREQKTIRCLKHEKSAEIPLKFSLSRQQKTGYGEKYVKIYKLLLREKITLF